MGASNSLPQTETINWKNVQTDQFSDIPNLYGISDEANKLVQKITIPTLSESSSTDLDNLFLSKINNTHTNSANNQGSENFSSTSPFISSDMYKYVMDKYQQQNMVGGGKDPLGDNSDTTSTSSSESQSSSESSVSSSNKTTPVPQPKAKGTGKNKKPLKANKIKHTKKNTEAFLEYVSSSAHTGGSITDNSSVANENNISISSVRTSQINLISE